MTITSTAFQQGEPIPAEYTCDGANHNPPLTFSEVPTEAQSLVLIVEDPDAPGGTFTHWLLYGMSPATMQILEHGLPETGWQGTTSFGSSSYGGPCPPDGEHRYFFKLYALAVTLDQQTGASRNDIEDAMQGHILQAAELMGTYRRSLASA